MRQFLRIPAFVMVFLSLLTSAACSQPRLKLSVWGLNYGEEAAGLRAQIAEFERRHPEVRVSVISMGAGLMNPQKLMTAIVGRRPPDVIFQDRFTIGDWASRASFMDLGPLIRRDRDKPMGVRPEDYYKPCWQEATYKGTVYAIPNSTDDRFLFYNRRLFREAGLDPDRPPLTWSELKEYTRRLTRRNHSGSITQIGHIPTWGNCWFYMYAFQNEAAFMSPDGRQCTLDSKESVQALEYMVDLYTVAGGVKAVDRFQAGFQSREQDAFMIGKVAMKIDGDQAANDIARFNPQLDFGVGPAPVPDERAAVTVQNVSFAIPGAPEGVNIKQWDKLNSENKAQGRFAGRPRFTTWSGGFSYAIPVGARHVEEAWEFIKWMNSPESGLVACAAQKRYNLARGRPFVPAMNANQRVNEAVFAEFAPEDPKYRNALKFALSMMPYSRFRPVTFVGQKLWDEHTRATGMALHYEETHLTPKGALTEGARSVQLELDRVYGRERYPVVSVKTLTAAVAAAILLALSALAFVFVAAARRGRLARREAVAGVTFALPWIIGFLVFTFGPIITSVLFSFCDYNVLTDARWVGVRNYAGLLTYDWNLFSKSLYNAAFMAAFGLPLGLVTSLALAMLLNNEIRGIRWYRTIFYMPSIVPVVASAVLWIWLLNPEFGLVNALWKITMSRWFDLAPPGWLSQPGEFFGSVAWWWEHSLGRLGAPLPSILGHEPDYLGAKSALMFMGLWGAGGGVIIWLAGLKGIPQQLYEAALLDGAGVWQRFRSVTLPMLSPYIFFNLVIGVIGVVQAFDGVYVMTNGSGGPLDATLVPVMLLFDKAFRYFAMGEASALAWALFVIILACTLIQLKLAPKWVYYESEKGG